MNTFNESSAEMGWQRKPGPPRVWRVVEGRKKTADGKALRFSIQEIPENRYEDVMDQMSTIFARDEPICESVGLINDPEALLDIRKIWRFIIGQGIVVGAFLVDENNPKPLLVGSNMILVNSEAVERNMKQAIQINSEIMKKIVTFMAGLDEEKNILEFYNVDKYITAIGLCVSPQFRGMGIGYHLLQARDDISVAYDIKATSTVFSAPSAQKAAARAGFDVLIEREFATVRNEDGTELFPGIKSKLCKLMGKRFL